VVSDYANATLHNADSMHGAYKVFRSDGVYAFINTSVGDANTGSDDDAGLGHRRKRGARSATRLAVWHRLALGQSCRYSEEG
jgi:hypothetical protein